MCFKVLLVTVINIILTTGCTMPEWLIYHPDINQGNYLSVNDIVKIKKGMSQQQVIYILGTPMLKDLFGQQIWYYIFRQQRGHENVKQQTLILTFNHKGILIDIKNNYYIT